MNKKLSNLYLDFMHYTLLIARAASRSEDSVWSEKEIELIHNLPNLVKCDVASEHSHFLLVSVPLFTDWLTSSEHTEANRLYRVFQSDLIEEIKQELIEMRLIQVKL